MLITNGYALTAVICTLQQIHSLKRTWLRSYDPQAALLGVINSTIYRKHLLILNRFVPRHARRIPSMRYLVGADGLRPRALRGLNIQ